MNKMMYSVSSLNRYVKQLLDNDINISSILVKGEVSNFTNHRSGHWYFSLKDRTAKISCVMFSSYACKSKLLLKEGMQVIVHASLSMYEAQGSCQLFVTSVQIDGLGDLYMELEQVKERLRIKGYFADEHKQVLPAFPMNIGVVTAKSGAAVQDILSTIARRWPLANVTVLPTQVQGIQAAAEVLDALKKADDQNFDVILLARGGGAIEDLWCFNDERLALFIYDMKTPIVTGVGHETDTTLVDYVSDARAPTPTAAAELITPDIAEIKQRIRQYQKKLKDAMQSLLQLHRQQLHSYQEYWYLKNPLVYVQQQRLQLAMHIKGLDQMIDKTKRRRMQLDSLMQHLEKDASFRIRKHQNHIQSLEYSLLQAIQNIQIFKQQELKEKALLLDAYSPLKILSRGYAIAYKDHDILHCTADLAIDDVISIRLQDGSAEAIVKDVKGT